MSNQKERPVSSLSIDTLKETIASIVNQECRRPRIAEVASQHNISVRTLQRFIRDKESSFTQLLDQTLREKASDLIFQTSCSLDAVAKSLGFSDRSGLSTAFYRWYNCSPSAYRQRKRKRLESIAASSH